MWSRTLRTAARSVASMSGLAAAASPLLYSTLHADAKAKGANKSGTVITHAGVSASPRVLQTDFDVVIVGGGIVGFAYVISMAACVSGPCSLLFPDRQTL
jgi:hypothetical protein